MSRSIGRLHLLALAAVALAACRSERSAPGAAPAAAVKPEGCVAEPLRAKGRVTSFTASASAAELCLAADGADPKCLSLSLAGGADGRFEALASPPTPASTGNARVRSDAKSVTVCGRDRGCASVAAEGFEGAEPAHVDAKLAAHLPADATPDGGKVFLVRHEFAGALQIYGETYDVASGKRLARFELPFDGHVERVTWLDVETKTPIMPFGAVFVVGCVEAGPGCEGRLYDPIRGELATIDGNFYGIDGAVQPLPDDRFAYVSSGGRSVVVRDERGELLRAMEIAPGAEDELGAAARAVSNGHELVIAYGGPIGGDVVRVDLGAMRVVSRATPKTCASR